MEDIEINLETPSGKNYSGNGGKRATAGSEAELGGKLEADSKGAENVLSQLDLRRSSHPLAAFFHVVFKSVALLM
jgi:hypothetical protein